MKIIITLLLIFSSSCGFQSVYSLKNKTSSGISYSEELSYIKVKKYRRKIDQEFRKNLLKILNPDNIDSKKKYLLDIIISESSQSTFTTSTGTSGREKIILSVEYKLFDIELNDLISEGSTSAEDDFNIEDKRFANYSKTESIKMDLTKIIAKNIRNMMINDVLSEF